MKFATFGRMAVTALLIAAPLGVASAADMAVKAPPPPPPPVFNWNGFYVGAYAGAAWMDQANSSDPCQIPSIFGACTIGVNGNYTLAPNALYDMSPSFIGGGRVGFNWQPTPYTLFGLENDIGYLQLKGSATIDPAPGGLNDVVAHTTLGNWYDAFTARLGAVDGHAMFYVKGGGVAVKYNTGITDNIGVTLNTNTSKTLTGWAAGGGIEYAIDMHWSVRAEYLVLGVARDVTDCGNRVVGGVPDTSAPFCSLTHTPDVQTITLGLNYRFH